MEAYALLDADSHVSEPLNLWQERLPAKYRDKAPRMLTEYEGRPGAWWLIEEERHPHKMPSDRCADRRLPAGRMPFAQCRRLVRLKPHFGRQR